MTAAIDTAAEPEAVSNWPLCVEAGALTVPLPLIYHSAEGENPRLPPSSVAHLGSPEIWPINLSFVKSLTRVGSISNSKPLMGGRASQICHFPHLQFGFLISY